MLCDVLLGGSMRIPAYWRRQSDGVEKCGRGQLYMNTENYVGTIVTCIRQN
jgi:hypothetical protein